MRCDWNLSAETTFRYLLAAQSFVYSLFLFVACCQPAYAFEQDNAPAAFDHFGWVSASDFMPPEVKKQTEDRSFSGDATPYLRQALATGKSVYVPSGDYHLKGVLVLGGNQHLQGAGVTSSRFLIDKSFDVDAKAVMVVRKGDGSGVDGLAFIFDQQQNSSRLGLFHYPWALDISDATRISIGRIRVSGAWNGIRAAGNAGGLTADMLEIGAFGTGVLLDGPRDFTHITTLHCWPFDFAKSPALLAVYADGGSVCAEIGRVDGLDIKSLDAFSSKVVFSRGGNGAARQIGQMQLDGDGATLSVLSGDVQIGSLSSTKSAKRIAPVLEWRGRFGLIGSVRLWGGNVGPSILVESGLLNVAGGTIENVADSTTVDVKSGTLMLSNVLLSPSDQQHTAAFLIVEGGILHAYGNRVLSPSKSGGVLIQMKGDLTQNYSATNAFSGWRILARKG